MPRYSWLTNSFTAGEVSSFSYSSTNREFYNQSCRELKNQIPLGKDGSIRRPGTEFISYDFVQSLPTPISVRSITDGARLIPFIFSKDAAYILAILPNDLAPYSSTSGFDIFVARSTSKSTTVFGPDIIRTKLSFTQVSWIEAFGGITIPNAKKFAGYSSDELDEIQYKQFGDVMVLTHPKHPPLFIQRLASDLDFLSANFVAYPFYMRPRLTLIGSSFATISSAVTEDAALWAFRGINTNTAHTLSATGTTGTVTITSSIDFFVQQHIGAYFEFRGTGYFEITGVTNATTATAKVVTTLPSAASADNWQESAWSDYRGWPKTSAFFQQRIVYGGNYQQPDTIWFSQTGDIYEMRSPSSISNATDPFQVTIASGEANQIQWMIAGNELTVGTLGVEYLSQGASSGTSSSTFGFSPQTTFGSGPVQAVRVNNVVTFLERNNRTVREFVFNFQEDSFQSRDLTQYASHMVDKSQSAYAVFNPSAYLEMCFQGGEESILWLRDSNGGLVGMTRNKETNTLGWHSHEIGGNLGGEPPKVSSICVVPNRDGTHDDLYLLVKRTVNEEIVYYIERIGDQYRLPEIHYSAITDANFKPYFLDSCAFSTGPKSGTDSTFVGFEHLKNESVHVLADGQYIGQVTVSANGELVLEQTGVSQVIAGYSYESIIRPQVPEAGSQLGAANMSIQRIHEINFRFDKTIGAKYGRQSDRDNLIPVNFRPVGYNLDTPLPLFTGVKSLPYPSNHDRDDTPIVIQDLPFPMNLVAIQVKGSTNDG